MAFALCRSIQLKPIPSIFYKNFLCEKKMSLLPFSRLFPRDYDPWEIMRPNRRWGLGVTPAEIQILSDPPFYFVDNQRKEFADAIKKFGDIVPHVGKDGFQVSMDIKNFKPNEITVKTVDNTIIVEGKHEEREDEHGHVSRQFVRKYTLPVDYDPNEVQSTLSSDGFLTIKAPPPSVKDVDVKERIVSIQHTGPAHLHVKTNANADEVDDSKKTIEDPWELQLQRRKRSNCEWDLFGMGVTPNEIKMLKSLPKLHNEMLNGYDLPGDYEASVGKNGYQVSLDVRQFRSCEINVKAANSVFIKYAKLNHVHLVIHCPSVITVL